MLALQAELASAIASAINVRLTPGEQSRLASAPSIDPAAHDAYLRGRFFFNRPSDENLQKAVAQFDAAAKLSPAFAPAYSGLSDAYTWAAYNEGFISAIDASPARRRRRSGPFSWTACLRKRTHRWACTWPGSTTTGMGANGSFAGRSSSTPVTPTRTTSSNQLLGIVGRFDEGDCRRPAGR